MKKLIHITILIAFVSVMVSCQKDFLSLKPLSDYSDADVWKDPALIETFVNTMYRNALGLPYSIERLSDYVDESNFTPDWGVTDFNKSLITADGLMGWEVSWATPHTLHYRWAPLYANVRACNIFFSKIKDAPFDDESFRQRLMGEVYFLRGYTYHYLVALYGGVPIITKPYGLSDNFEVARNTYEECINFIVSQFDSAAMYLPLSYPSAQAGRATKGAALAMKARTLLYAASDLHANMSSYASGYAHPELLGYPSGDRQARWTAARNAAKAVMDLGIYGLYKEDPNPGDSIAKTISDYFISYGYENEDILLQYFTPKTDENWNGYNPALYCGPNGYHNWGNNCPLGELVDDYEMKDGSKFDWNDPAMKADPYANREARFYATVLYEGAKWRKRPTDVQVIDPWDRIQIGHVYNPSGDMIVPGVDTREGPIENWNGSYTHYYTRKFVNPEIDPQYVKQDVPFRHIRYAEVLLNYAEACIETGMEDEARYYINLIRKRAGQPPITETGAALRERYRHERRIELAYEDHRFWDVRRWLIGPQAYHQTHGIDVRYVTDQNPTNYRKPDGTTWSAPVYTPIETPGDARAWDNKAYFFPIMRDELNKNTALVQNPGYN